MAIKTEKTTKEVIRVEQRTAMVKVYVTNGDPEKVTIAWPQRDGGRSGWWEHVILDYPEVLPDLYKAIGEAMEYINLAKA